MMHRRRDGLMVLLAVAGLIALLQAACNKDPQKLVVAKVDGRKITAGDLANYTKSLPKAYVTRKKGLEGYKDHLQTLIDRDLLVREADRRGLAKEEAMKERVRKVLEDKMLEEFENREISAKIQVSDEEVRDRFKEMGLGRSVKVAHITTKSMGDALQACADIKAGMPFGEAAAKWSVAKDGKESGGDLKTYFTQDKIAPALRQPVFSLKTGEVSAPIKAGGVFEVAKILDERPVGIDKVKGKLDAQIRGEKFKDLQDALVENLKVKHSPKLHSDVFPYLSAYWSRMDTVALGPEGKRVIYDFRGGKVQIRDFVRMVGDRMQWRAAPDTARIRMMLDGSVLPRVLLLEAARHARLDRDQAIQRFVSAKRDEVLIEALRKSEVVDRAATTANEVRQEYEDHKMDVYSDPPTVGILEIMVKSEEEARGLLGKIRAGEDMTELAMGSTVRDAARDTRCVFHLHPFEKGRYGEEIVTAAFSSQVGDLVGPIRVKDGYSVFRVLSKTEKAPQAFEKVEKRAQAAVRQRREDEMFDRLVASLRSKYARSISVNDENLRKAVAAGVLTGLNE